MSSATDRPVRSAAWKISLWGTLAFAFGTLGVFLYLQRQVGSALQLRTDAWLTGETETLSEVAERTPKDALYDRAVREVAEMASHEIPGRESYAPQGPRDMSLNKEVFFLQTAKDGSTLLWVGTGDARGYAAITAAAHLQEEVPQDIMVPGADAPFRVAADDIVGGGRIYLGVSERDEIRVLWWLRIRFLLLWLLNVLVGFGIIFWITRGMLGAVRKINAAAERIDKEDLSQRVPESGGNDEVSQLAVTLNGMLARIEQAVHQLHTMTNSLAHDLRSPLTAVRARLEMAIAGDIPEREADSIEIAINELDRLTEMLSQSLDVAEAQAHALRLELVPIHLGEVVGSMIELYHPSMSDKGLRIELRVLNPVTVLADAKLLHRVVSNLLDNELKHLPASRSVIVTVRSEDGDGILTIEDDGPGFDPEIVDQVFSRGVKSESSGGHGIGLAFVEAVAKAHGGSAEARNRLQGGAHIEVRWPLPEGSESADLTSELAATY